MYAIFHNSGIYMGYKEIEYEGEEQTFEISFFLVSELPSDLKSIPENHIARISKIDGDIVVTYEEIPSMPKTREDELTQLKLALAEMAEAHETEKTELQLAIAELAELITQEVMSSGKDIL